MVLRVALVLLLGYYDGIMCIVCIDISFNK